MRALLVEQQTTATYPFITGLHEATHCSILHNESIDDAIDTIHRVPVNLLLVTLIPRPDEAWRIAERIRTETVGAPVRYPRAILLVERPLPVQDALRCRDFQAPSMLRGFPEPVYEEARVAFWALATRSFPSTIRIEFCNGHHRLYFCAGELSEEIDAGRQLVRLAVTLAGGRKSYTVESLADDLGICKQSVKKYMAELRRATTLAQQRLNILTPNIDVFWMERQSGGTLCGISANVVWV